MVFNSVSASRLHMNECLLTLKRGIKSKLFTWLPGPLRAVPPASPQPQHPLSTVSLLHAHWPPLGSPPRPGFSYLGLPGRSFPLLDNSCPALRPQLKWHLPSPCPCRHLNQFAPVGSLSTLFFFFCGCLPAHYQLTSNF